MVSCEQPVAIVVHALRSWSAAQSVHCRLGVACDSGTVSSTELGAGGVAGKDQLQPLPVARVVLLECRATPEDMFLCCRRWLARACRTTSSSNRCCDCERSEEELGGAIGARASWTRRVLLWTLPKLSLGESRTPWRIYTSQAAEKRSASPLRGCGKMCPSTNKRPQGLKSMRENWCRPFGTGSLFPPYPALTCRAITCRRFAAGFWWCWFHRFPRSP